MSKMIFRFSFSKVWSPKKGIDSFGKKHHNTSEVGFAKVWSTPSQRKKYLHIPLYESYFLTSARVWRWQKNRSLKNVLSGVWRSFRLRNQRSGVWRFLNLFLSASHTKARTYCNTSEVPEVPEENKIVLPQHIWAVQVFIWFLVFVSTPYH